VGFEVAHIPLRIDGKTRLARESRGLQRFAHREAVAPVDGPVEIILSDLARARAAAEEVPEMALLIAPSSHIDRAAGERRILFDGARRFERKDDAERTIEPTRIVLALEMRPTNDLAPSDWRDAEDIADAIYRGLVADHVELALQPRERGHVLGRKRGAVHARF